MRWAMVGSGDQEGARDLVGGQAAEQAQRQRHPRLGRQHRMAGGEDQAQQVVADVVVERRVEVAARRSRARASSSRPSSSCLRSSSLRAAELVDGAVLGRGHQPGARVVRDARLRPLLERGDQRVLRQLLGQADVAHHARQAGDEPRRLDPPDRVDGAMGVGGRHGYRSDHLPSAGARSVGAGSRGGCMPKGLAQTPRRHARCHS